MAAGTPGKVLQAQALAQAAGFRQSCTDAVGQLLAVLAGAVRGAPILEIGTGMGVGTAWLALSATGPVVTVERDPARAESARTLFGDCPAVTVVTGDWVDALAYGPFGLICADVKAANRDEMDRVVDAALHGGLILLDDLTPVEQWPREWQRQPDPVRERWLRHPGLVTAEIRPAADQSALLACRRPR